MTKIRHAVTPGQAVVELDSDGRRYALRLRDGDLVAEVVGASGSWVCVTSGDDLVTGVTCSCWDDLPLTQRAELFRQLRQIDAVRVRGGTEAELLYQTSDTRLMKGWVLVDMNDHPDRRSDGQ